MQDDPIAHQLPQYYIPPVHAGGSRQWMVVVRALPQIADWGPSGRIFMSGYSQ